MSFTGGKHLKAVQLPDADLFAPDVTYEHPRNINSVSVFEQKEQVSDVTFLVEGKEIHFCKSFLRASSPVFERMLTSDFKEKESAVIPLPGKTIKAMDIFLQQLHPVHCWRRLKDDVLDTILHLADEYQVDHLRLKCNEFLEMQYETNSRPETVVRVRHSRIFGYSSKAPEISCTNLSLDQVLLYLRIIDKYKLNNNMRNAFIELSSGRSVQSLEDNSEFKELTVLTQKDVLKERSLWLENRGKF